MNSNGDNIISSYKSRNTEFRRFPPQLKVTLSPVTDKLVIDKPLVNSDINTGDVGLCSVSCLSERYLWTCSWNNIMILYNLQGELVKSIQNKSGNTPQDIAVGKSGDLVYIDDIDRTVNMVQDTQIHTVIRQQGWKRVNICCTSSGCHGQWWS